MFLLLFPVCAFAAGEATESDVIELPLRDENLAIFVKQRTLWVVSNNVITLPLEQLSKKSWNFIGNIKKIPSAKASLFNFSLKNDVYPTVEKSEDGITITLSTKPVFPEKLLGVAVNKNDKKQKLIEVNINSQARPIVFADQTTGSELQIFPIADIGAGVAKYRDFIDFNLLPTAQGVVIRKKSDDLTIENNKGIIEIGGKNGLNISNEIALQIEKEEGDAANLNNKRTIFPYAAWKLKDDKDFLAVQNSLSNEIAYGSMDSANKSRLNLLGMYLAQGLFAEAIGMSNDILRNSLKFYRDNKVAAMRGAAYFFMYRIQEAERDFSSYELRDDKEAAMWLALCGELLSEEKGKFNFVSNYESYIRNYPPVFIQKLALIAADVSINRREYNMASTIFDYIQKDKFDAPIKKYVDYMRAKIFSETKNEEEAAKIWEAQIEDVDTPLIRARAEFSLVNMLLRQGKISSEKAAKRLDKLRIVWRGDSLELNAIMLQSNIYIDNKQYSKALKTLREVVLYYPQVPEAIVAASKMTEIFSALYNKGLADTMPPLEALALFYEFRDLVPVGKDGDTMIRNLAERLVKIDMLDRATQMLDHQVQKRLQGEERTRVGTRLASIYLMNHQPKQALETLKVTGYGDLPQDLLLLRLRLTAKALAEQGRSDKSIDVLTSDTSPEGTLLRLSIYWDNKDWTNVILSAEEILSNRNDPTAPLTKEETGVLLKLATAYVYDHDTGQIQYLRDYFTPLLKNNPDKDSFLFITSESGTLDYANINNLNNDINSVKTFLATNSAKPEKKQSDKN